MQNQWFQHFNKCFHGQFSIWSGDVSNFRTPLTELYFHQGLQKIYRIRRRNLKDTRETLVRPRVTREGQLLLVFGVFACSTVQQRLINPQNAVSRVNPIPSQSGNEESFFPRSLSFFSSGGDLQRALYKVEQHQKYYL